MYCENCAIRLFNKKHHNLQGIGNPMYGNLIIVPNVDYDAYKKGDMEFSNQVNIITHIFSTGVLEQIFIAPLIRCNLNVACDINDSIIANCMKYLIKDLVKYDFKNILVCGKAVDYLLHTDIKDNLNTIFVSRNKRRYSVNYSPLIKYTDDTKFEVFKNRLIKWYNDTINKNYVGYNFKFV